MKEKSFNTLMGIILGLAIILGAIFIPASEVIHTMFIILGIVLICFNIMTLVFSWSIFNMTSSLIGIVLGFLLIFVQDWIVSMVVAIYLVILPLINHFAFSKNWSRNDVIKICLGLVYLVFTPLSVEAFDIVIKIVLIILGVIVIIGAIIPLFKKDSLVKNKKDTKHIDKSVDYDFSDK